MDFAEFQACDDAWTNLVSAIDAFISVDGKDSAVRSSLQTSFASVRVKAFAVVRKLADDKRAQDAESVLRILQTVSVKISDALQAQNSRDSYRPVQTRPGMIRGTDAAIMFLNSSTARDKFTELRATTLSEQLRFQRICLGLPASGQ
jgi:hypothetical protein